jgi:hypothetical protein
MIFSADWTSERLRIAIPVSAIGEPVAGVKLAAPRAAGITPAYCSIDGAMAHKTPQAVRWTSRCASSIVDGRAAILEALVF